MPQRKRVRVSATRLRDLFENGSHYTRKGAAELAGKLKDPASLELLRAAMFDMHRSVRLFASRALTRRIGLRATAEFILKRYPRSYLGKLPLEFFLQQSHSYTIASKRAHGIGEQSLADSPYIHQKYGKPVFRHRGLPVVQDASQEDGAQYKHGVIAMDLRRRGAPKKFRRVIAEHEYGETWGWHQIGQALELIYLKKNGLLKDYIKRHPWRALRIWEKVIQKDKEGFKEFAPYFARLLKRYPGGSRQHDAEWWDKQLEKETGMRT
jgi:hypothetical protein